MSCPLRRFDDAKLQASSRPTNTVAAKELADRLATMNQERQKQDTMWIEPVLKTSTFSSVSDRGTNVRKIISNESR
jgi:hypothetical protein